MTETGGIPYRALGRTGELVSLVGLGGFHMGRAASEQEAITLVRTALDSGVNFLDNCWSYHGGLSEVLMGKALRDGYRDKAFLMTKIDARSKRVAAGQIDECLRRLQVKTIDLLQIHEIIRLEDPGWVFAPDGAIEALVEARQAGKIRFIGFTGHKDPTCHLKMLKVAAEQGFRFDAVQMPLNVLDHHYQEHSFEKQVLPVLVEQGIGVLGMKPLSSGRVPTSGTATATECLHYAMSLPTSVVITGCESLATLDQALAAVRSYQPPSQEETATLLARTAELGAAGDLEPFKTTTAHDSTTHHPDWMWEKVA